MREVVRLVAFLIGLFTAIYLADLSVRLRGPPGPVAQTPVTADAWPVERVGEGLVCVATGVASANGLHAFDRSCRGRDGPYRCGRMSTQRRLLVGGTIDLQRASVGELEALPGIGPRLAKAIVEARPADLAALAAVRGVGHARASAVAYAVGLDDRRLPDICSTGLWPTISSGYGRLR
jgi:hypothetical protein